MVSQLYYPPHLGPREKEKSLDDVLKIFRGWLEESVSQYLNEQQTPDWWLQMDAYKNFFKNDSEEQPEDLEFTEEEKDDVKRSAHRFKLLLAENFEQTPIQAEKNNSQIDYLANAPGRVNRVDWRALAFSTLMGILVNLSVDTEKGEAPLRTVSAGV